MKAPAVSFLVVTDRRSPVRYVDRDLAFRSADRYISAGLDCEVDELRDEGVIVWRWNAGQREWTAQA